MISFFPKSIEEYVASHSPRESSLLRRLVRETYLKTKIPQMQVGRVEGAFLRFLVQIIKAKQVLEIGTFTGYSALCMAEGLSKKGQLITLDNDPESTNIAKRFWAKSVQGRKIKPILGEAIESLKKLNGPFDLVFIDADKANYIAYWESCVPKLRKGGLIVVDNVLWSGHVLCPKDEDDYAIADFNQHVAKDKRVEAVMLTIRDGITLARKL